MTFHNILLPEKFSNGSQLGPGWGSSVVETARARFVTQTQTAPRWRYDLVKAVLQLEKRHERIEAIYELQEFYNAIGGAAGSFKLLDPYDHSTARNGRDPASSIDDATLLGATDGSTRVFQMAKTYTRGTASSTRPIALPIPDSELVFVNSVLLSEGSDYTIDATTGRITLSGVLGATTGLAVHAACQFWVPVAFEPEADQWLAVEGNDNLGSVDSLPVREIPSTAPVWDLPFLGGYTDHGEITGNESVSLADGQHQRWINSTGTVHGLFLPPKDSFTATGGPIFYFENDSTSASQISVLDGDTLAPLTFIAGGEVLRLCLVEVSGAREWRFYS